MITTVDGMNNIHSVLRDILAVTLECRKGACAVPEECQAKRLIKLVWKELCQNGRNHRFLIKILGSRLSSAIDGGLFFFFLLFNRLTSFR